MNNTLKLALVSMGLGFIVGAVVTVNNKKVKNVTEQAQTMAMEKLETAKEGLDKIKVQMTDSINKKKDEKSKKSKNNPKVSVEE